LSLAFVFCQLLELLVITRDEIRKMRHEWPNHSPEPTAVGAVSSAVAVHVVSRRWLSFFR